MNGCFYCCKDRRKTDSFVWPQLFLIICQSYAFLFQEQETDLIPQRVRKQSGTDWLKSRSYKGIKCLLKTQVQTHTLTQIPEEGEDNRGEFSTVTKLAYTESSLSNFTVWQCVFWWHTEHTYNLQSPSSRWEMRRVFAQAKNHWEISTLCTSLYHCCNTNAKKKGKTTARSLNRANPLF